MEERKEKITFPGDLIQAEVGEEKETKTIPDSCFFACPHDRPEELLPGEKDTDGDDECED